MRRDMQKSIDDIQKILRHIKQNCRSNEKVDIVIENSGLQIPSNAIYNMLEEYLGMIDLYY